MTPEPNLVSREALLEQLSAVLPDENRSPGIPPACYADAGLLALNMMLFSTRAGLASGEPIAGPMQVITRPWISAVYRLSCCATGRVH